ncbi:WAT1-related protein At5g64700-like [Cicer arietinum]|uniref:WAT1-related protein n=1 Tax=Cicer arietinum TaxID=3827 RepID=A0A1S2Z7Y6_CICAR|nr:WAT1-related protein At5g64700-like [Cicer arietinum]
MSEMKRENSGSMKSAVKEWFNSSQAFLSMFLVQIFATGMQLLSRVILVQGTYIFALIAYRHLVAAICVAPFALYFERERPKKFNCKVWLWLFVNALVGMTMALGLFYYGLRDTSATYAVNFLNMVPICTFFISIIFRMENMRIGTWVGKVKCIGAILCVGGALTTSLYKGKAFYIGHHSLQDAQMISVVAAHQTHKLRGTIFLVGSCCSYTAWFIIQVKLMKVFPLRYWGTMLSCVMSAVQSAIIGVCINSSEAAWRLEWNLQLITIVYSGAMASAATFCLISWTISIKGPTYPPMFNPLALVFVAISEAILLGEPLTVGTLLGMVLIIVGLYSFLWGKTNDMLRLPQTNVATSELSTIMVDDSSIAQSTAVVVPSSSLNESVLQIDKINKI